MTPLDAASALVVVDMQVDFGAPDGSLYVRGGEQLLQPVNALVDEARAQGATVVYTQDWHPPTTPHFAKDGGLWPVHCVAGTGGADFMKGLRVDGPVVRKGRGSEDGYSGFSERDLTSHEEQSTQLGSLLQTSGVRNLVVVGLAGDYCVKATALDGVRLGYDVEVPLALTRFVELTAGEGERAVEELRAAGVRVPEQR